MNKRIYVGEIQEFWKNNSKQYSKLNFKVLFNKDEILNHCKNHIQTSNLKNMDDYDIEITIYEYAYERYEFEYFDGLVLYFNKAIKSSENIYDNILKCINCNVFKYDINIELVDTYVQHTSSRNYNITFADYPLLEEDCIENYTSKFKYYMHEGKSLNKNLESKQIISGLSILYIKFSYLMNETDECLFIGNYNLDEALDLIKHETLSIIDFINSEYNCDINEYLVEVYNVAEIQCNRVFKTTDINYIIKEEK